MALLIIFLFLLQPAWAGPGEPQLKIRGKIIYDGSKPRMARVRMESLDGGFVRETIAGLDGEFSFKEVPKGLYYISVEARGYGPERRTFDISPALADESGLVNLQIEVRRSARRAGERTVSVRRLSIPQRARSEFEKAARARGRGRPDEAERHLVRAIEIYPEFSEAINDLGTIYHRRGEYEKSIALFRRAIELEPEAFAPHVNLAGSLLAAGRSEESLSASRRALELNPDDALANAQMGIALYYLGRDDEAIVYLEKAKSLDPAAGTYPQLFLSEIRLRRQEIEAAIGELEEFLTLHPEGPRAEAARSKMELLRRRLKR